MLLIKMIWVLIFTSCLELKPPETFLRGISKSTELKESRLKEPTEPSTTQRNLSDVSGRGLDCSFLSESSGLHLDYRCLQFLLHFFLIKVTNNCGHSVPPAASHYKIYLITVSTLGKIVHIAVLPSSIYHMEPHLFYFTYVQTNFI